MLAYLGVIAGVLLAFMWPWFKKNADLVAEGKAPVRFAANYVYALVISVITVLVTIAAILSIFEPPSSEVGLFAAFWGGFVFGGLNAFVVKLPFDWLESKAKGQVVVPPPSG